MIRKTIKTILVIGLLLVAGFIFYLAFFSPFLGDPFGTALIYIAAAMAFPSMRMFVLRSGSAKGVFAMYVGAVIVFANFGLPRLIHKLDSELRRLSEESGFRQRSGLITNLVVRNEFANFNYEHSLRSVALKKMLSLGTLGASSQYTVYLSGETSLLSKVKKTFSPNEITKTCNINTPHEQFDCFKGVYQELSEKMGLSVTGHVLMLAAGTSLILNAYKGQETDTAKNEKKLALLALMDLGLEEAKFSRSAEQVLLFPSSNSIFQNELAMMEAVNTSAKIKYQKTLLTKFEKAVSEATQNQREPASSSEAVKHFSEKLQKFKLELASLDQDALKADRAFDENSKKLENTLVGEDPSLGSSANSD